MCYESKHKYHKIRIQMIITREMISHILSTHCYKLSLASASHSSIYSVQEGQLMQLSLHTLYQD